MRFILSLLGQGVASFVAREVDRPTGVTKATPPTLCEVGVVVGTAIIIIWGKIRAICTVETGSPVRDVRAKFAVH